MRTSQVLNVNNSVSQLILASSSPRRKELVALLDLSLPVSVFSVDIDETIDGAWQPAEAVERLSLAKAKATYAAILSGQAPYPIETNSTLLLAADTVVTLEGTILGKPASRQEAIAMLQGLQGKTHEVFTGIALLHCGSGEALLAHRSTKVAMRALSDSMIERYVRTGESDDKAGAYGIQGKGANLVDSIEGCYFNVVGLPISLVAQKLEHYHIDVLQSTK